MKRITCLIIRIVSLLSVMIIVSNALALPVGADTEETTYESAEESADEYISVEQVIAEGFYSLRDSIDISAYNISPGELSELFSSVVKDDPYLFFVDGQLSYSYQPGGCVLSLKPRYKMRGKELFEAWDICRAYVRETAKKATEWESESARALFLHDYVCDNFSYDESLENDNMYLFIKNGRGTCQAYTDLYNALLRECGIDSHFVASDTIAHIWNYARIDGEWYHVDLTWDDGGEEPSRRHFLLSDGMAENRGHKDWYSAIDLMCNSEVFKDKDLSLVLHEKYEVGDVDHSGETELLDILMMLDGENICEICSDMNFDGAFDENDILEARKTVLKRVSGKKIALNS